MKELPDSLLPLRPRDQRNLYEKLSHALILAESAAPQEYIMPHQKVLSAQMYRATATRHHPGEELLTIYGSQAAAEGDELSIELHTWVHHDIYGIHRYDIDPKQTSDAWHIYQDPDQQSLPMIDSHLGKRYIEHTYISRAQGHMLDEIAEMALQSLTQ